ncbi:MAG: T9SS type A sorting domain-containing protein [Bacteroidetes bacterium]|nr:T9SS type A sorting domain-containing protein [Bacteroidota bacterium]
MKTPFMFLQLFFILSLIAASAQNYYVLTPESDTTTDYYEAAQILAAYRSAQIIQFDIGSTANLAGVLAPLEPRYIAIVADPIDIDINFVRQFLMMSAELDDDPFSDFAYGYITGATGQDAINFVNNIIYAESQNIQDFPLNSGGCAASSINMVYQYPGGYMEYLDPPVYADIYLETSDAGTGVDYFNAQSNHLLNKKILDIGHNGDPHMIWLFEGGNMDPDPPVWNYDPAKIEDPAYARVGLTGSMIGALNLYPAVTYNGACHSGEPKTVMVEGDIAATFGDTQGYTEFYTMSDTFSFALSILKTGITGYFAPCGANNANDQGEEVYNTFLYHEPLGDIHKRAMDGVVMGFLGNRPALKIYEQGEWGYGCDVEASGSFNPNDWSGACYMLGGKANRIYFGDPLYNPFENDHDSQLEITTTLLDSVNPTTLDVFLEFDKPDTWFPVWDKFHYGDTRIDATVEIPDGFGDLLDFEVIDSSAAYHGVIHAMEEFDGKRILHIEVDIPDDFYDPIYFDITFRLTFENTTEIHDVAETASPVVFPNPSTDAVTIRLLNPEKKNHTIVMYNSGGQEVLRSENITGCSVRFDNRELADGLYFFRLFNENEMIGSGKFMLE